MNPVDSIEYRFQLCALLRFCTVCSFLIFDKKPLLFLEFDPRKTPIKVALKLLLNFFAFIIRQFVHWLLVVYYLPRLSRRCCYQMSKILVWSYFYQRDNCVYIKNGRPLWKKVTTKVTNPIDGGTFLRA